MVFRKECGITTARGSILWRPSLEIIGKDVKGQAVELAHLFPVRQVGVGCSIYWAVCWVWNLCSNDVYQRSVRHTRVITGPRHGIAVIILHITTSSNQLTCLGFVKITNHIPATVKMRRGGNRVCTAWGKLLAGGGRDFMRGSFRLHRLGIQLFRCVFFPPVIIQAFYHCQWRS